LPVIDDGPAHAWPQLIVLAEVAAAMLLFSRAIGECAALQQWWHAVGATPAGITRIAWAASLGSLNRSEGRA
jgi:hypothetical protein